MLESKPTPFRRVRARRGQIMVLGVLGILIMSLMVLLTLNIGKAVFERIELQTLADASAFSAATQEARVFNFMAYSNRANVASLVAAASLHTYMSIADAAVQALSISASNFSSISDYWQGLCCCCCGHSCSCCCEPYCTYARETKCVAGRYGTYYTSFSATIRGVDSAFKSAISALDAHMDSVHKAQIGLREVVKQQLETSTFSNGLKQIFAKTATRNDSEVAKKNKDEYDAAFQPDVDMSRWVGSEIANATRWTELLISQANRMREHIANPLNQHLYNPTSFGCTTICSVTNNPEASEGMSKIIERATGPVGQIVSAERGPKGGAVGAYTDFDVSSVGCGKPEMDDGHAHVASGSDGSAHVTHCNNPSSMHKNLHCLKAGCFTLFKINDQPGDDFGQPSVFMLVEQTLRSENKDAAWELNDKGKIKIDLNRDGSIQRGVADDSERKVNTRGSGATKMIYGEDLELADVEKKGLAVSKALVYYHWPQWEMNKGWSGWKKTPNFFNPYWKAKLQPYRRQEFQDVVSNQSVFDYSPMFDPSVPLP